MPHHDGKAERLEGSRESVPARTLDQLVADAAVRVLNVAQRFQEGAVPRLVAAAAEHGLRYAYHLQRQSAALRERRHADMRPHLQARLSLAAAQHGAPLGAVLDGLGLREVIELDHALLERQADHAAEHIGRLPLAETTDLYSYFRYFGDFRTASWLRTCVLDANLREQARVKHVMPAALAAALEQGRPDLVLEIVDGKPTRLPERMAVAEVTAMAHALRGDVERAERTWRKSFSDQDRAFGDAVRDLTVAVVGPAPASEDLASEIDSFDRIVRPNYLGEVDPRYGSRADIAYYNGVRLRTRHDEICSVAPKLSWLVTVRSEDAQLRQMLPGHRGIRSGHNASRLFLDANPLAVPNMLTDLIRFRPRRIKLFGFDFFTSPSAYGTGYHTHQVGSEAISHSLRIHEAISSFRFVQELRRAGLCEADARLEQVLSMSCEQYAARLQELHGRWTVVNRVVTWHPKPRGS